MERIPFCLTQNIVLGKKYIRNYLKLLGDSVAEKLSDVSELHLPVSQKEDIFDLFVKDFYSMYGTELALPEYFTF